MFAVRKVCLQRCNAEVHAFGRVSVRQRKEAVFPAGLMYSASRRFFFNFIITH